MHVLASLKPASPVFRLPLFPHPPRQPEKPVPFQAASITPAMLTRYLTLISAFVLILIIIRNLFTRQQQRRLDTAAKQIATILLISSLIAATYTLLKS